MEKTLAGRPAGFGQKEKEEDESKWGRNLVRGLGVCSTTRFSAGRLR